MEFKDAWLKYKRGILITTVVLTLLIVFTEGLHSTEDIFVALLFAFFVFSFLYLTMTLIFLITETPEQRKQYRYRRKLLAKELKKEQEIKKALREKKRKEKWEAIQEKEEERNKQIEEQREKHNEQVKVWQTEDLNQYATKLDQIKLKKTEYCYYVSPGEVTWSEEKSKVKRINYGGFTGNIHIAKGLNYRLGSIRTEAQRINYWDDILTGHIFLTNRRVIVMNDDHAKSYPFTRLMRMIPYNDGVELISDAGKRTIIKDLPDAERFNIYLDRLTTK